MKLAEKKCIIQNKKGSNSVSQESKTKIWPNFGFVIRKTKLNWGLVPLRTWYYRSYIWSYPESFHHCLFRSALQNIYTVLFVSCRNLFFLSEVVKVSNILSLKNINTKMQVLNWIWIATVVRHLKPGHVKLQRKVYQW